jgi:hypothetical protein
MMSDKRENLLQINGVLIGKVTFSQICQKNNIFKL